LEHVYLKFAQFLCFEVASSTMLVFCVCIRLAASTVYHYTYMANSINSVLDQWGISGQKPAKVSYMTLQINRKFVMIWWEQWELTCWNSILTPCIEKLTGTLHKWARWTKLCSVTGYLSGHGDAILPVHCFLCKKFVFWWLEVLPTSFFGMLIAFAYILVQCTWTHTM